MSAPLFDAVTAHAKKQKVSTRDSHKHRKTCTGTDKYSFKSFIFDQLIDCCGFTDNNVCFKFNTEFFNFLDLFLNNFLFWKTEFRNTINKNSTKFMKSKKGTPETA